MELIVISESKLKIMLTADDMENYSISNEDLSYERKDTRRVFGRILNEAREKTGFDSDSSNLFIQVYPSKNGGCEIYVTVSVETSDRKPTQDKRQKDKNAPPKKKKEYCVYLFDSMANAISACKVLLECGYKNESRLYVEKVMAGSRYYLVLQEETAQVSQGKKKKSVSKSDLANEFGRRIGGKEKVIYIKEHARAVLEERAIDTISGMG